MVLLRRVRCVACWDTFSRSLFILYKAFRILRQAEVFTGEEKNNPHVLPRSCEKDFFLDLNIMAADEPLEAVKEIERVLQVSDKDYFALLRISTLAIPNCTIADVRASYKKAVMVLHPDKIQDEELKKKAADAFGRVEKAYSQLKEEATLKRFRDAAVRKRSREEEDANIRRQAAVNASRNASATQQQRSAAMEADRIRKQHLDEKYLEAVRLEKEREQRKKKEEKDIAEAAKAKTEIEDQTAQWQSLQSMLGM